MLVGLCLQLFASLSLPGWNQAGRLSLCSILKLGESSVRLCLAPDFRMALRSWGSCLCVKHLHLVSDCRKTSDRVGLLGGSPV